MKTDYEYISRRILRKNGEIRYEVNLVHPNNEMECLTVFRAVPGKGDFGLIEERGEAKNRSFYGVVSINDADCELKNLADKFQVDDFMARLKSMMEDK